MNKDTDQSDQSEELPTERYTQRGIYLLPNILTTAALFAGFYSIVASMKGFYETAAIAIFIATIADGLDGRVARLTNTQSAFGAEYDSLSDMVAFGIAPALAMYSWALASLGKLGWVLVFLYAASTALRLARFNTQVNSQAEDKKYFQGLPCPPSAALVASSIWMGTSYAVDGPSIAIPLGVLTLSLASLMVSTIRYSSFKSFDFKGRVPFFMVVFVVFMTTAIAFMPAELLFLLSITFVLSGPIMTLWHLRRMRKRK